MSVNLLREAFGVRGIPALSHLESGGMRRTPNASRNKLTLMAQRPGNNACLRLSLKGRQSRWHMMQTTDEASTLKVRMRLISRPFRA
jgi:hypothetical protein